MLGPFDLEPIPKLLGSAILGVKIDRTFIAAEVDAYDDAASVEAAIAHDLAHP